MFVHSTFGYFTLFPCCIINLFRIKLFNYPAQRETAKSQTRSLQLKTRYSLIDCADVQAREICKYGRKICRYAHCSCIFAYCSCIFAYLPIVRAYLHIFRAYLHTLLAYCTCTNIRSLLVNFLIFIIIKYAFHGSTPSVKTQSLQFN